MRTSRRDYLRDLEHNLIELQALIDAAVTLSEWEESSPPQANAVALLHISQKHITSLQDDAARVLRHPDLKVVS